MAAALSGDEDLAAMIREGLDMHGRIADLVWGAGAWTKSQRYSVKAVVFGKMYGAGKAALARQMGEHGARVDEVISAMEQLMPGFMQWAARLQQEVRSGMRPVWRHPSGRLTYLPSDTPHKAVNYAIQSSARETLCDALLRWEQVRPGHLLLPIHDEILVAGSRSGGRAGNQGSAGVHDHRGGGRAHHGRGARAGHALGRRLVR